MDLIYKKEVDITQDLLRNDVILPFQYMFSNYYLFYDEITPEKTINN